MLLELSLGTQFFFENSVLFDITHIKSVIITRKAKESNFSNFNDIRIRNLIYNHLPELLKSTYQNKKNTSQTMYVHVLHYP